MKKRIGFVLIAGMTSCSWMFRFTPNLKETEWLIGTWKSTVSNGNLYETWAKKNNQELIGKSYLIKNGDTIVLENIRLVQEKDQLFYIPTVVRQNNNLPVRFALKTSSQNKLVFENRTHDFPQIISYTKITSDSLVAEIAGIEKGKKRIESFPMSRVK